MLCFCNQQLIFLFSFLCSILTVMQEAHTEALKRRTATNTVPAAQLVSRTKATESSQHALASSSQPTTISFRPPRGTKNSSTTVNVAPRGSTSTGRGWVANRGRGGTNDEPGGGTSIGWAEEQKEAHEVTCPTSQQVETTEVIPLNVILVMWTKPCEFVVKLDVKLLVILTVGVPELVVMLYVN